MAWTTEMVEHLTQLWMEGMTTNDIARELGMSKNSVVGKVHRLNLMSRPSPIKKKEDEQILSADAPETVEIVVENEEEVVEVAAPTKVFQTHQTAAKDEPEKTCIKLSELDNHTCRWPIGDPKDEDFCFCGKRVRAGQTYCDEHAAIAYVRPVKK